MSDRTKQIGFSSQRIRIDWMDYAARLAQEASSISELKAALFAHLGLDLAGDVKGKRSSREKALTVLMRSWITPPPDLEALRDDCLVLVGDIPDSMSRVAIHWAMIGAAYPFWLAVAARVGRLLRLQQSFTASQVRRRLSETYGDRELVFRASRTVLRSYVDWGVLMGGDSKGSYGAAPPITVEDPRAVASLVEAILRAAPGSGTRAQELLGHPALFPFALGRDAARGIVAVSKRLTVSEMVTGKLIMLAADAFPSAGAGARNAFLQSRA